MELADIDIYDPDNFVAAVPHEMFTTLRREAPVYRHPHPDGSFFWAVTRHEDIVTVNRDAKTFSSSKGRRAVRQPLRGGPRRRSG